MCCVKGTTHSNESELNYRNTDDLHKFILSERRKSQKQMCSVKLYYSENIHGGKTIKGNQGNVYH